MDGQSVEAEVGDTAVGPFAVQRAQLHHLAQLAGRPTIDLQVLPAGGHAGVDGTFTVVDFPPELGGDPGAVYVQTLIRGIYYEQPAEIAAYRLALTRLQAHAIAPTDAPAVITRIAEEITP